MRFDLINIDSIPTMDMVEFTATEQALDSYGNRGFGDVGKIELDDKIGAMVTLSDAWLGVHKM